MGGKEIARVNGPWSGNLMGREIKRLEALIAGVGKLAGGAIDETAEKKKKKKKGNFFSVGSIPISLAGRSYLSI